MTNLVLNGGGRIKVTPAGGGTDLDVIIDGVTYTESYDTNVATTIDNFITSHSAVIKATHGIFLVDGATTLDLEYVFGRVVTSEENTVAAIDYALQKSVPTRDMVVSRSGAVLTLTLNEDVESSSDVVTLNLADEATAIRQEADILYQAKLIGSRATGGVYSYNVPHYATFA
jgi:hypothetical protein